MSLAAWVLLTGGLHLDGLADSADAWLGGLGDMEKTHRILKDPLVGAAGVIALISILLLKFVSLLILLENGAWLAILLVGEERVTLLHFTDTLTIALRCDGAARLFAALDAFDGR